jgi:hypothetical protein
VQAQAISHILFGMIGSATDIWRPERDQRVHHHEVLNMGLWHKADITIAMDVCFGVKRKYRFDKYTPQIAGS